MKKYLILIAIWLFLAAISAVIGFLIINPMADSRLSDDGVMTKGRVTKKEPENHRTIYYSYEVLGHTYSGMGSSRNGNPDFEDISIGQEVIVFYDPQTPEISYLGYPKHHFQVNLVGVVFITLVLPTFMLVPLYFIHKVVVGARSGQPKHIGA